MRQLLIELYGKYYLSIDFAAREALITALSNAVGASPRPKEGQPSIVGMITARNLGLCVVISAANQKIIVRTEDVPALLEALTHADKVLNRPTVIKTNYGEMGVMCYEPPKEETATA